MGLNCAPTPSPRWRRAPKAGSPGCNWPPSLQGHAGDRDAFIDSFTGSHRFVMDYLVEEVLLQQPAAVQTIFAAHGDPGAHVRSVV
jgi:hypothetical protein